MKKTADTFYMTQKEQKKLPFTVPVVLLSVYIFGSAIRSIILRNYITAFVFMVFSTLIYGTFPLIFVLRRNSVIDEIILDAPLLAGGLLALFCFFKLGIFGNMLSPFKSHIADYKKGYYDFDDDDNEDYEE